MFVCIKKLRGRDFIKVGERPPQSTPGDQVKLTPVKQGLSFAGFRRRVVPNRSTVVGNSSSGRFEALVVPSRSQVHLLSWLVRVELEKLVLFPILNKAVEPYECNVKVRNDYGNPILYFHSTFQGWLYPDKQQFCGGFLSPVIEPLHKLLCIENFIQRKSQCGVYTSNLQLKYLHACIRMVGSLSTMSSSILDRCGTSSLAIVLSS